MKLKKQQQIIGWNYFRIILPRVDKEEECWTTIVNAQPRCVWVACGQNVRMEEKPIFRMKECINYNPANMILCMLTYTAWPLPLLYPEVS